MYICMYHICYLNSLKFGKYWEFSFTSYFVCTHTANGGFEIPEFVLLAIASLLLHLFLFLHLLCLIPYIILHSVCIIMNIMKMFTFFLFKWTSPVSLWYPQIEQRKYIFLAMWFPGFPFQIFKEENCLFQENKL